MENFAIKEGPLMHILTSRLSLYEKNPITAVIGLNFEFSNKQRRNVRENSVQFAVGGSLTRLKNFSLKAPAKVSNTAELQRWKAAEMESCRDGKLPRD